MKGIWTVGLVVSLAAVGLSGCYVVSPHPYPVYVPVSPAPAYVPPPSGGAAPGVTEGSQKNCQTVTVEGHNETRVAPSGQRETIWVPAHEQQVCQ